MTAEAMFESVKENIVDMFGFGMLAALLSKIFPG